MFLVLVDILLYVGLVLLLVGVGLLGVCFWVVFLLCCWICIGWWWCAFVVGVVSVGLCLLVWCLGVV